MHGFNFVINRQFPSKAKKMWVFHASSLTLSTCIRKYGNVFIIWFIHSIYSKV